MRSPTVSGEESRWRGDEPQKDWNPSFSFAQPDCSATQTIASEARVVRTRLTSLRTPCADAVAAPSSVVPVFVRPIRFVLVLRPLSR